MTRALPVIAVLAALLLIVLVRHLPPVWAAVLVSCVFVAWTVIVSRMIAATRDPPVGKLAALAREGFVLLLLVATTVWWVRTIGSARPPQEAYDAHVAKKCMNTVTVLCVVFVLFRISQFRRMISLMRRRAPHSRKGPPNG